MGREKIYLKPKRVGLIMEETTYELARRKAEENHIRGGFSAYVNRLIIADMKNKGSAALKVGRILKKGGE